MCVCWQALLLGLYPRGRKTAIFDVRVRVVRRIRALVTCGYSMEARREFLFSAMPILQLAFVEYVYNFVFDFMPVESRVLCIDSIISTSYATMCDQFRERCIHTGEESWSSITASANIQMDKLIRNMRMGPSSSQSCDADGKPVTVGTVIPMCTPSLPKKRRTAAAGGGNIGGRSRRGERELYMHPDAVIMSSTSEDTPLQPVDDQSQGHQQQSYTPGGLSIGVSSTMTTQPAAPLNPSLFDMHICMTDNLHLLYPSTDATAKEMQQIHALHRRLKITMLPACVSRYILFTGTYILLYLTRVCRDQQEALDKAYESNAIRASASRVMYVCTSCALSGKPVPLRPPMRYSMLHSRFTCLTCHRSQRARGQQQQRRDKGARLTTSDTSIVAIDMIGKVLYTSMDLPSSVWRCYIFCIKCANVHEVQDGPASNCPLSPHTVIPTCMSYHMMMSPGDPSNCTCTNLKKSDMTESRCHACLEGYQRFHGDQPVRVRCG